MCGLTALEGYVAGARDAAHTAGEALCKAGVPDEARLFHFQFNSLLVCLGKHWKPAQGQVPLTHMINQKSTTAADSVLAQSGGGEPEDEALLPPFLRHSTCQTD